MKASFHTYIDSLRSESAPAEYIAAVERNARPLFDRNLPIVLTLGQLASITNCNHQFLYDVVGRKTDPYRTFQIRKRSGGTRTICVPHPALLAVQRWIHAEILRSPAAESGLSMSATAYRKAGSHMKNASRHLGAEWVLKVDISSFFESISERQVYRVFRHLGYRSLVAFCFTRLCTRVIPYYLDGRKKSNGRWNPGGQRKFLRDRVVGHLAQGAPTSPMLANFVCTSLDRELEKIARDAHLVYSRYADDMTFSGGKPQSKAHDLVRLISKVISESGFAINVQKTNIARKGSRRIVTGLSIEGPNLRLPRVYKSTLRKDLYYIEQFGLDGHCAQIGHRNHLSYMLRLDGRIGYAEIVEPNAARRFREKFNSLFPDFQTIKQLVVG